MREKLDVRGKAKAEVRILKENPEIRTVAHDLASVLEAVPDAMLLHGRKFRQPEVPVLRGPPVTRITRRICDCSRDTSRLLIRAWHEKRNFTAELQLVWSMNGVRFTVNELPELHQLEVLLSGAWGTASETDWSSVLSRSICFVCSYEGDQLIGFVNVAWDGGLHASIFDTTVHPRFQRQGIGVELVKKAIEEARFRGAKWLHVDFEPHLAHFYGRCGFQPTQAGLIPLRR